MTKPKSRQAEAFEANGWPNPVAEYDPHGVAAGGMYSECKGCSSRRNYGPNPWSAPGTARAVDFVMGGSGGNMLGVCGASPSRDNDYNTPLDGHWGMSAKTTYKAGDVIDVEWCVSVASRREHNKYSALLTLTPRFRTGGGETARWTTAWCPADVETPKPTSAKQDEPCCRATGDRADITDEWCESVSCAPVYVEGGFCTRACDGPAPGPAPGPVPTSTRRP